MKRSCLIAVLATIALSRQASASSMGFFQRGMKVRMPDVPNGHSATVVTDAAGKPVHKSEEGRTWIKITNVSKLWPDSSTVPKFLQYFFAVMWVFMIASLPFILPIVDHKPVTHTQKLVGALMLVVLFGGLYLFTNVILFQSVHFKQVRPLTIIECIYFMSQVITTVGYGDITPAKPRGQVFVALYVLGALSVIAMLVSQVIDHCTELLHQQREKMWGATPRDDGTTQKTTVHDLLAPKRPSLKSLLGSLAVFCLIDFLWVVFFSTFPGEHKTVFEAFYMSLITLTTVGFGAITPLTEEGMIFNAFFMLVGSAAMGNLIMKFCEFVGLMIEFQRFGPDVKREAIDVLRKVVTDGKKDVKDADVAKVTDFEFFRFIIQKDSLMTEGEIDGIRQVFANLEPMNGTVDFDSVVKAIDVERSRRHYFDDGRFL